MTKTKLLIAALTATLALSTQVIAEDHKGHDASEKSMKCGASMKEKAAKPSKCGADHMKESGGKCAGKEDAKKEATTKETVEKAHDH